MFPTLNTCAWPGVTCGTMGVTILSPSNNNLVGLIPSSLENLANITFLTLGSNELTGPIPAQLENLTNLTHLFIYNNLQYGDLTTVIKDLQDTVTTLYLPDGSEKNDCGSDWNECESESDEDGVDGAIDNCPTIANAGQANCDRDGLGDVCDFINDDPSLIFPIQSINGKTVIIQLGCL